MITCKECKFWKRVEKEDREFHGQYAGECSCDKFVYGQSAPKDGLEYWDSESYCAGFFTGEDFGCIHGEK